MSQYKDTGDWPTCFSCQKILRRVKKLKDFGLRLHDITGNRYVAKDETDLIPVPTDYRWYKDKLYTPFIDNTGLLQTMDDVICRIRIKDYWNYTKEELVKSLRKALLGFILIDGVIHVAAGEPRYVINTFGLGHNHGGTGFFVENFYNPNIRKRSYFSALQREEAIAYGKRIAYSRGDTESIDGIGTRCDIQVFIPEAVKCNPKKEHTNGCSFMNSLESLVSGSNSAMEAGLLVCMGRPVQILLRFH